MKWLLLFLFSFFLEQLFAETHLRIMPLGDSITCGAKYAGGYRTHLAKLLKEKHIDFEFVGSQSSGNLKHEGHSGFRIDQLASHISPWMMDSKPDIILLMIGTNDMWVDQPTDDPDVVSKVEEVRKLLELIFSQLRDCRVILSSIPPTNAFWNHFVIDYNRELKKLVSAELSNKRRIVFVDSYEALKIDDLDPSEGATRVHPIRSGYEKIAITFASAIKK